MKIAHIIWSLGVGGAQTLLVDIANIQSKEGHEVGIFVVDSLISETIISKLDKNVRVFLMGRQRGKNSFLPFVHLNWKLWRFKPDIIHSHSGKIVKVIFNKAPKVATIHNMTSYPSDFKKYDATFAISESVKKDWINKGGCVTAVIENGVSIDNIMPKTDWSLKDIIHIVVLSRIRFSPKRQDLVVTALQKLLHNNSHNLSGMKSQRCIVHFIGEGEDSEKLKNLVKEFGLENDVVFEGLKDRNWVYNHLCDFDLFVQASDFEGFGLTVAEACAAKLPVLISNIDGPLEIIDGGRLGMTFKKGDANDLALKIELFLKGEYDTTLIEQAYLRIKQQYSIEKTVHEYLEEYCKLLNTKIVKSVV